MKQPPAEKWLTPDGGFPCGNWPQSELVRYVRADRITALEAERDALAGKLAEAVEAMKELHDDMLERSRLGMDVIRGEQYRVVNAGNGAWTRFCVTLAKLEASHDAD